MTGNPGPPGSPPGNLYVVVHVPPHPVFGRKGNDLTVDLPVTYAEATLGANVPVPTLNGPVTLKVPAGTQPGRTFRIRGKGAPKKSGHGDMLVTVNVAVPKKVSREEKSLLKQLQEAEHERLEEDEGGTKLGPKRRTSPVGDDRLPDVLTERVRRDRAVGARSEWTLVEQ